MVTSTQQTCPVRQHMPDKPIPTGVKLWVGVDGSGFVFHAAVYNGKPPGRSEKGLSRSLVRAVLAALPEDGHVLFCDNFFGSLAGLNDVHATGNNAVMVLKGRKMVARDSPAFT